MVTADHLPAPVRTGPDADFLAILKLVQNSFAYMDGRIDPPSSMHRLTLENVRAHAVEHEIWQIEIDGALAACVFFTLKPDCFYLGKLAVAASYRGSGLARTLVELAEERARFHGHTVLRLEVRVELVENLRAFAKLGFVITGESAHEGYARATSFTLEKSVGG